MNCVCFATIPQSSNNAFILLFIVFCYYYYFLFCIFCLLFVAFLSVTPPLCPFIPRPPAHACLCRGPRLLDPPRPAVGMGAARPPGQLPGPEGPPPRHLRPLHRHSIEHSAVGQPRRCSFLRVPVRCSAVHSPPESDCPPRAF